MAQTSVDAALAEAAAQATGHGGAVWVGFSGGVDSTALLLAGQRALAATQAEMQALHINHGLSTQSDEWAAHCRAVCERAGIRLHVIEAKVARDGNMEANARRARYAGFARFVGGGDTLWLAHHLHDQLETGLLRLLQGRGVLGMRASGRVAGMHVARPLLGLSRDDLVAYVRSRGIDWIEDHANHDLSYDRNFIRHRLLPPILQRWSDAATRAAVALRQARSERAALVHELAQLPPDVPLARLPRDPDVRAAWLQALLEVRGHFGVSRKALVEFSRQIDAGEAARIGFSGGLQLVVRDGYLSIPTAGPVSGDSAHVASADPHRPSDRE